MICSGLSAVLLVITYRRLVRMSNMVRLISCRLGGMDDVGRGGQYSGRPRPRLPGIDLQPSDPGVTGGTPVEEVIGQTELFFYISMFGV